MNDENSQLNEMPTLVVGAGGTLGFEVVKTFRSTGAEVVATIRQDRGNVASQLAHLGARVEALDLGETDRFADLVASVDQVVMIPPLTQSWPAVSKLDAAHLKRILFFSSNNATVDHISVFYDEIRRAENEVQQSDLPWTILRPTMIFGFAGDTNISRLMSLSRMLPFMMVPGAGRALQQPIYYKDLAKAAAGALYSERTLREILQLGGPDIMSLKDMYRIVSNGGPVVPLPLGPLKTAARLCEKIGVSFPISSVQLRRVEIDKAVVTPPNLEQEFLPKTEFKTAIEQLRREWAQAR